MKHHLVPPCFPGFSEFKHSHTSLQDEIREGHPKSVDMPENIKTVRKLILQDRQVTYREIEASLGISSTRKHSILHEHLAVKKSLFALGFA